MAAKPVVDNTPVEISQASISATAIQWTASGTYDKLVLTVSGPDGFALTRDFPFGTQPMLRVVDLGKSVADGSYTWELRAVPRISPDVRRKLQQARDAGADQLAADIQAQAGLNRVISEAGGFNIADSRFVGGEGPEAQSGSRKVVASGLQPTPLDQVYPDDVIVQGSLCVGFDCVNNESFGFDTIRLKENNTRIKFEDTSTGSYPTNDWQLTANDSASGGSSKFSIEDITGAKVPFTITAGASTNSIFVDSTGRVGFRTSTPVLDLHVATSNTPAIRLEQNNSGGFTAQTWDIGANEANFFVRDVTGGSKLSLRIRPGAPTSSVDISADGDVGVGTGSPTAQLHVRTGDSTDGIVIDGDENPALRILTFSGIGASSPRGSLAVATSSGAWSADAVANDVVLRTESSSNKILLNAAAGVGSATVAVSNTGVTVNGTLTVTGAKNFAMPDPADAKRAIYYAALEGPEAGTYFRGTAKTVNGEAVIELPGYFARVTEKERITVQLTPIGSPAQLYITEQTPARLVVKVAEGTSDAQFNYFVQGVRKGYLDYAVERDNDLPKN